MVTTNNPTGKRLLDVDIRAIFSSMSNKEAPQEGLNFSIIRLPQEGTKLSPPTFELENGLYVLLRSSKSKLARVPSTLSDKLLSDSDLASLPNCSWSLSGPQYPKPLNKGDLQQRYCYPRGKTEYSNGRGGAMWTMIDKDGNEDIDLRVLHVYEKHKATKSSQPEEPKKKRARKKQVAMEQENPSPYKKITHNRGGERGLTIHYSTNKQLKAILNVTSSEQEKKISTLTQELEIAKARRNEEIDQCKLHVAQMNYLEASHKKKVQVYKDKIASLTKQVKTMEMVVNEARLKQGNLAEELDSQRKSSWCDITLKNEEVESLQQILQTKDKEIKLKNEEISKLNEFNIDRVREEEEYKRRHKDEIALLSQELGRQLMEKQEQISTLTRVSNTLIEQKQSFKAQYDRLQTAYSILEGEAKESSQEVQSLRAEVSALNSSMKNLQDENSLYKHDIVTLQEEKEAKEAEIKQLTTLNEDQKKVNGDLLSKASSLELKIEKMQSDEEVTIKLLKKDVTAQKAIAHKMKNKVKELTIDNQYLANINSSLGTQQTAMQERINILENKLRQAEGQQHEESSSEHTAEDSIIDLLSSDDEEGDESAMSTKVAAQEKRELTTKKEEVNESDKSSSSSTAALSADIGSQNDNDKVHDEHQTKKKGTVVDTDALSDISNKTKTPKKKSTNKAQEKGVTSVNEAEVNASLSLKETTSTKSSSPTTALSNIGNSQNSTSSASKASSPSATMNSTMNSNTDSLSSPVASCKRSTNTNTTTTPKKSCEEYKDSEVHEDGSALGDSHLNSPQLSSESFETEQGQGTKRKRRRPVMFSPNLQSAQKRKSNTEGLERKERSNTDNQAGETINVGDVGYKFKKYFPSYRGWYDGEVVEILRGAKFNRRCKYTDGDIEDYSLADMRDKRKFKPRD